MLLEQQRGMALDVHRLRLATNVEVHESQLELRQRSRTAKQCAIDSQLRPVNGAMAVRHAPQIATVGLEFLQAVGRRVVTIGASANAQLRVLALQRDLRLVCGSAATRQGSMA